MNNTGLFNVTPDYPYIDQMALKRSERNAIGKAVTEFLQTNDLIGPKD